MAIRRSQDVAAGKYSLGTRPIPKKKNRNSGPVSGSAHIIPGGPLWAAPRQSSVTAPNAVDLSANHPELPPAPFRHLADVGDALPTDVHHATGTPSEATLRIAPATKQPSKGRFLWILGSNPPIQEKAEKPSSISSDGSGGSSGIIVIDPLCLRRGRRDSPQAASDPTEDATASAPMRYGWSAVISTASALADVAPMGSVPPDVVRN